jgi:IclR family transcriptional regulator, KDG regulon repressor
VPPDSSVLKHAIAILDCFSAVAPDLGVRDVARRADLTSSTAGRLMAEMKELGILQQNSATRTYAIGSKVLAWAAVYNSSLSLRTNALPLMEELRRITGETITLYLVDGKERLCVERMESFQNVRMVSRLGQRLPLYAGSGGKAILAFLPPGRAEEIILSSDLKPYTPYTMVDRDQLRNELETIRQQGFAASFGEWLAEAAGVAAPILGGGGEVLGALTISGPNTRFSAEKVNEYAGSVKRAAREISQSMGYITYSRENPHEH